jgi:NADPH:quinone reductase-like Zn-dependent oxidoreductase
VPIAVTRTGAKREALRGHGAPHVIATAEQDLVAEVQRITGGKGARVAFDPVAGPGVEALAQAAAPGGILVIYGGLAMAPTPFPLGQALSKGLTLRGYTLFELVPNPERLARTRSFILDGLAGGKLKPVIARTFPFEQIVAAHRFLESNEQIGKVVVTVD